MSLQEPHAEDSVIGGLLMDPDAYWRIDVPLRAEHFTDSRNRRAFGCIQRMINQDEPVDAVTVAQAGGGELAYLFELARTTPTTANLPHYARLVFNAARRRGFAKALRVALSEVEGRGGITKAQAIMTEAAQKLAHAPESTFAELVQATLEQAKKIHEQRRGGSVLGVSWCLPAMNHLTGGLYGPKLVILGGRPGCFKTSLAMQIAVTAAAHGQPVGIISLEMGATELTARAIANRLRIDGMALSRGDPDALAAAEQAGAWDWPLFIEDRLSSWPDIAARIAAWRHRHRIELIIVDYLQIVSLPGNGSRYEKLSAITREAKLTAQRLGIPVVMLVQIARAVERENRRPTLADIRDSGSVEQDADIVAFLHKTQEQDEFELLLAKNRHGPAGAAIRLHIEPASYRIGERFDRTAA